jgi:RNA polymerase sigma-70 factor (sigma-E family)
VSDGKISPHESEELQACFAAHARRLFGYACVLSEGDRALASDLVQAAFEAAGRAWDSLRFRSEEQRNGWLRRTLASIAMTGSSREAALGDPLYRQGTQVQESRFSAGYDLVAGLERYRVWLSEQTEEPAGAVSADRQGWSADRAVTELYSMHYRQLVRLSALLVRDIPTAEEVVQDAFIAMHGGWQRLRDAEKALAYLRQAVVNRSRSVLRHRTVVDKNTQNAPPDMPSAEHGALTLLERSAVVSALRDLPERQRQAIVLRYYADLSEAEIADAMQISRGAVKSHTARAMAALRAALEQE